MTHKHYMKFLFLLSFFLVSCTGRDYVNIFPPSRNDQLNLVSLDGSSQPVPPNGNGLINLFHLHQGPFLILVKSGDVTIGAAGQLQYFGRHKDLLKKYFPATASLTLDHPNLPVIPANVNTRQYLYRIIKLLPGNIQEYWDTLQDVHHKILLQEVYVKGATTVEVNP